MGSCNRKQFYIFCCSSVDKNCTGGSLESVEGGNWIDRAILCVYVGSVSSRAR